MKGDRIAYFSGIKYQLATDYTVQTDIRPRYPIRTEYVDLRMDGTLTIRAGFGWDGPSGPAPDLLCLMRGSLVHDAVAYLMRRGYLDFSAYFHAVNKELEKICLEDGCQPAAAELVFFAVDSLSNGSWAKFCSEGEGGDRPLCFAP